MRIPNTTVFVLDDQTRFDLRKPHLIFTTETGAPQGTMDAERGVYSTRTQTLEGWGNVLVKMVDGRTLKSPHVVYNLPDVPADERNLALLCKRALEMDVPEMMASFITERTNEPWEFYRDYSRQLWDEARHAMMGTHNAVLKLGPKLYLELLAIDPEAPAPPRPRWFELDQPAMRAALATGPRLIAWAARTDDLDDALMRATIPPGIATPMTRGDLAWRITVPEDGMRPEGGVLPVLIQWTGATHPCERLPESGVTYYDVPAEYHVTGYRYTYVNDHAVLVDPRTHRIVQIID